MLCKCSPMSDTIFPQHVVNEFVTEMCSPICDQCRSSSEPGEYMTTEKACYHFGITSSSRYGLHPFRSIIYGQENYRLLKDEGKGPIKSIPQILSSFTSKICCKGCSSRFDMLPILWHLSLVDTKWCASLNKVGQ